MSTTTRQISHSSFRDPAGFVFYEGGELKRAITYEGREDYDLLISSGLYDELVARGMLIPHAEETAGEPDDPAVYKIIVPERVRLIGYPYEWCFSQFQDAAMLTLEIQRLALRHGMAMKDASAFNVQFRGPHPILIDTLSFARNDGRPWAAYAQFCRHFLAPLLLMAQKSLYFGQMFKLFLDGVPLDFASALLPKKTYLRFGTLTHLHLHARWQTRYAAAPPPKNAARTTGLDRQTAIVESLLSTVRSLKRPKGGTEWSEYYGSAHHYSHAAETAKANAVTELVRSTGPRLVWDLGGNTGSYSRLVTAQGVDCVCFDLDPLCVEKCYTDSRLAGDPHMHALVMDLANPTPPLGFALRERQGFLDRCKPDLALALALIQHLRISANVPFARLAEFFALCTPLLLIEFVPKEDPMVQFLLRSRPDTFHDYTVAGFEEAFGAHFETERVIPLPDVGRSLYRFRRRS